MKKYLILVVIDKTENIYLEIFIRKICCIAHQSLLNTFCSLVICSGYFSVYQSFVLVISLLVIFNLSAFVLRSYPDFLGTIVSFFSYTKFKAIKTIKTISNYEPRIIVTYKLLIIINLFAPFCKDYIINNQCLKLAFYVTTPT